MRDRVVEARSLRGSVDITFNVCLVFMKNIFFKAFFPVFTFSILLGVSTASALDTVADGDGLCSLVELEGDASVSGEECECVDEKVTFLVIISETGSNSPLAKKLIKFFNSRNVKSTIGGIPCGTPYDQIVANAVAQAEGMAIVKRAREGLDAVGANYKVEVIDVRLVIFYICCSIASVF